MEGTAKACADNDGEGDGEEAHSHVGHRQGHHKVVGDALEIAVEADSPTHQHVSGHGQRSDQQLQADVKGNCVIHASCFTVGVVWDWELSVALIAGSRSFRLKAEDSLSRRAEELSTLPSYSMHAVSVTPVLLVLLTLFTLVFQPSSSFFFPSQTDVEKQTLQEKVTKPCRQNNHIWKISLTPRVKKAMILWNRRSFSHHPNPDHPKGQQYGCILGHKYFLKYLQSIIKPGSVHLTSEAIVLLLA